MEREEAMKEVRRGGKTNPDLLSFPRLFFILFLVLDYFFSNLVFFSRSSGFSLLF